MKDIAKRMIQARLPVVRQGSNSPAPNTASKAENPPKPLPTHSVYRQHDSWSVRNRREEFSTTDEVPLVETTSEPVQSPLSPREAQPIAGAVPQPRPYKKRRGKLKPDKIRNTPVSVNMSAQEYEMVRAYVEEKDLSVSEWIRALVFKGMGKPIPSRRRKKG